MKIEERYSVSRNTSNLKIEAKTTFAPADILAAAGMAGQKYEDALLLWEITFKGKTSAKLKLIDMLTVRLHDHMVRKRIKGRAKTIATEVMAWHLYGTCQPCGGRGPETILGTPMLSDKMCKHCQGTGKITLPRTDAHEWLADYMAGLVSMAGGKIMHKIANDLDFV